ncbi:glycoside hydrolase family 31 protein [Paenibacillus silviterrae]|uniref:glycoside hydrolase family 31 protein n=1 Tax=Paenibacillus silviterrae TaxID=3242194 RepID=UPI002543C01F|nr:glycoside hydrolase family 31 protein [Paenibacillus chinjuensis]
MIVQLRWQDGGQIETITKLNDVERELISTIQGAAVYDLDAGGSAGAGGEAAWFRAEWAAELPENAGTGESEYILLDFGMTPNIRKLTLYLDGVEIGKTRCSSVDTQFVVPAAWLRGNPVHSLLLVVNEGVTVNMWLKGKGRTPYQPPGYTTLLAELPGSMELRPLEGLGSLLRVEVTGGELRLAFTNGWEGRLTLFCEGVFRFTAFRPDEKEPPLIDSMVLDELDRNLTSMQQPHMEEGAEELSFAWNGLQIRLNKEPFELSVFHEDNGELLFRHTPEGMSSSPLTGMSIELSEDEQIFGLGENATPTIAKRGQREEMWVAHDFVHCDVPVPFYISTKGYGLYFNNSYHSIFDMGGLVPDRALLWAAGGGLDYFFIHGPAPKAIVAGYSSITGKAKLPPRWAFGFWQSRTGADSADAVLAKADRFKQEGLPLDVIGIDPPWMEDFTEFKWNSSNFPEPQDFVRRLKERQLRLILWSSPFVNPTCGNFEEGAANGHFFRDENGSFKPICWWKGYDSGLVDFTSPEAVTWWRSQLLPLLELGVDGLKIDGGDGSEVPSDLYSAEGRTGSELHNLYPLYFAKAIYGIFQEARPNERVLVWERTGFAGSGKYPCTWGGDQLADYSGTRVLIKAGQAAGLVGIPFWSQDVGGFCTSPDSSESFFIRSYQWGLLSPLSRAHGDRTEPWAYGDRAFRIVKEYIKLRYRLLPYLYSLAYGAVLSGVPMMRPLFYEFPEDTATYGCDYQYMLGDGLLVAPIVEETEVEDLSATREIYLPSGEWIDYWTEQRWEGGRTYSYDAAIDKLPLFVKSGTLLPMAPPILNTTDYDGKELFLHYYPDAEGTEAIASHYLDDGVSLDYRTGAYDCIEFSAQHQAGGIVLCIRTAASGYSAPGSLIRAMLIVHAGAGQEPVQFPFEYSIGADEERSFTLHRS